MTDSIASSTATSNEHAHTHSRSEHETTADIFRDYLRQFRAHGAISTIDDGEGDDVINSDQWHARIYGGEGDDVINSTGYDVDVYGGSGDDIINVQGGHVGFVPNVHVHVSHGPWQGIVSQLYRSCRCIIVRRVRRICSCSCLLLLEQTALLAVKVTTPSMQAALSTPVVNKATTPSI